MTAAGVFADEEIFFIVAAVPVETPGMMPVTEAAAVATRMSAAV
jgi:hypothetical protein